MTRPPPGRGRRAVALLAAVALAGPASAWPHPVRLDDRGLVTLSVGGFAVRVAPALFEQHPLSVQVLDTLEHDLRIIADAVPPPAFDLLRARVTIWIERQGAVLPGGMSGRGMVYHPSAAWLRMNGLDPARAGGVEIVRAEDYLDWRDEQPMMVLHEFAHAYHHLLGVERADVRAAYERALGAGLYDKVGYVLDGPGRTRRAYAMNNPTEYFAELSEAMFGRNDYEPFDLAGLVAFDPEGYIVIRSLWSLSRAELVAIVGPPAQERAADEPILDR